MQYIYDVYYSLLVLAFISSGGMLKLNHHLSPFIPVPPWYSYLKYYLYKHWECQIMLYFFIVTSERQVELDVIPVFHNHKLNVHTLLTTQHLIIHEFKTNHFPIHCAFHTYICDPWNSSDTCFSLGVWPKTWYASN